MKLFYTVFFKGQPYSPCNSVCMLEELYPNNFPPSESNRLALLLLSFTTIPNSQQLRPRHDCILPHAIKIRLLVRSFICNPTPDADLLNPTGMGWNDGPAIRIPTAGLICVELHITDWTVLRPGDAMLRWFIIPRLVKAIT